MDGQGVFVGIFGVRGGSDEEEDDEDGGKQRRCNFQAPVQRVAEAQLQALQIVLVAMLYLVVPKVGFEPTRGFHANGF